MRILIVDDEMHVRQSMALALEDNHEVYTVEDGPKAYALIEKNMYDLVITDNHMPAMTGLELIEKAKLISPDTAYVLMTAYGNTEQAVKALQNGVDDYFLKPIDIHELELRVRKILKIRLLNSRETLSQQNIKGPNLLIGQSPFIKQAKDYITKIADVDAPVLLLGPSGVGKEVMAKSIHESSKKRSQHPFVAINCASLNENMIESELFGHEKGSFTGASQTRLGKFELAQEGTLFLDEIGELSLNLQAKLLRVLQEKEFYRVGGTKLIKTNVRILTATLRDLKTMVSQGTFREDLYFRLNVLTFSIPSLNERKEDIPLLIDLFWQKSILKTNCQAHLSPQVIEKLVQYNYPGNIRELQNTLERLAVLGPQKGEVSAALLPTEYHQKQTPQTVSSPAEFFANPNNEKGLEEVLSAVEFEMIKNAMQTAKNNQSLAARILKINRATLQYKLKKYGLGGEENAA